MELRQARQSDLPQLKQIYQAIIAQMEEAKIAIWDEVYPIEFFPEDIEKEKLYVLMKEQEIVAAFALCDTNDGADQVEWKNIEARACYIDRLGVNVTYSRQGIGSLALQKAMELAREKGAEYLRLFVVDYNQPAIALYEKNGFQRAKGIYREVIDETLTLQEYGYEIAV